jgi:molecular chaperone GrpE
MAKSKQQKQPDDQLQKDSVDNQAELARQLAELTADLKRIEASPGTAFDPELHEAIQMDEDAKGDQEVIAEELQAGYTLNGNPIRHAMVKVTRQ